MILTKRIANARKSARHNRRIQPPQNVENRIEPGQSQVRLPLSFKKKKEFSESYILNPKSIPSRLREALLVWLQIGKTYDERKRYAWDGLGRVGRRGSFREYLKKNPKE